LPEPFGGDLLKRSVSALSLAGLAKPMVVCSPGFPEVIELAESLKALVLVNPEPGKGMFSSVLTALNTLRAKKSALILPVDAGLVEPDSILSIISYWQEFGPKKDDLIVLPAFRNKLGHPPIIGKRRNADIIAFSGDHGLKGAISSLTRNPAEARSILSGLVPEDRLSDSCLRIKPLEDPSILTDVDTVEDLERFSSVKSDSGFKPQATPEKALTLLSLVGKPIKMSHSLAVALGALRLAVEMGSSGASLAFIGGVLHDLDHGRSNHARAAKKRLTLLGWTEAAFVVGSHTQLNDQLRRRLGLPPGKSFGKGPDPSDRPVEEEVSPAVFEAAVCVHMADKYLKGPNLVSLDYRFDPINHNITTEEGMATLKRRLFEAESLEKWFHRRLGQSPRDVIMSPCLHPLEDLAEGVCGQGVGPQLL
jgi:CTP:molybdopterin cytidylyltransferase MocA